MYDLGMYCTEHIISPTQRLLSWLHLYVLYVHIDGRSSPGTSSNAQQLLIPIAFYGKYAKDREAALFILPAKRLSLATILRLTARD